VSPHRGQRGCKDFGSLSVDEDDSEGSGRVVQFCIHALRESGGGGLLLHSQRE